jgi:hypothetical protein
MDFGKDVARLGRFEIDALVAVARSLSDEEWFADASRQQTFDTHHSTQTIKLIADADFRHENPTVHSAYARFEPHLAPLMAHIRAYYSQTLRQRLLIDSHGPGYFIRAILTRLPPGGEIHPHVDEGYSLKRCHRIHVPIVSNSDTIFRVGSSSFHMPVGEMWEINNRRIHAVKNGGAEARIHLIMDYVQPGETVFDADGPLTA